MIKPIELRLGNRIYKHFEDGPGEEIEVSVRDIFDAQRSIVEKSFKFSFSGIPLTEEWLLKFGFIQPLISCWKLAISDNGSELESSIQIAFAGGRTAQVCRSGINAKSVPCKYVHQLQNLYFALTGKELELTPSTV